MTVDEAVTIAFGSETPLAMREAFEPQLRSAFELAYTMQGEEYLASVAQQFGTLREYAMRGEIDKARALLVDQGADPMMVDMAIASIQPYIDAFSVSVPAGVE